jgi:hypothetical protein
MSKILSKDGKIAIRSSKVLDTEARPCCCANIEYARPLTSCCQGSRVYWVRESGLDIDPRNNQPATNIFIDSLGVCWNVGDFASRKITSEVPGGSLYDQPIGISSQFENCDDANRNEACAPCDRQCCTSYTIPDCSRPNNQDFIECLFGSTYRFRYTKTINKKRWGDRGGEYCITGEPPPDAFCASKCFGRYFDLIEEETWTWTADMIVTRRPIIPDDPTSGCATKVEFVQPATERYVFKTLQLDGVTFTNMENGVPTYNSQIIFINPRVVVGADTLEQFPNFEEALGRIVVHQRPEYYSSPVYDNDGNIIGVTLCDYSKRLYNYVDTSAGRILQGIDTFALRNELDCLSGFSHKNMLRQRNFCSGTVDGRNAFSLTDFYEQDESFRYDVTILSDEFCDVPDRRRIAFADGIASTIPMDPQALTAKRAVFNTLTKGCHSCRTSSGL